MSGGAAGGVQNYKGVMLCNRPQDDGAAAPDLNPRMDAPRFRPGGLPSEALGLNPAKENLVSNMQAVQAEAARRRAEDPERLAPETFLTKHRRWLADMAAKKAALSEELQRSAEAAATKRQKFEAYSKALRKAVRERAAEYSAAGVPHTMPKKIAAAPPSPAAPSAAPAPAPAPAPKGKKGKEKPKWAMTEAEADDVEDEEAAALVDFASGLDYDKYMDDLEVREALSVIRDRIDTQKAVDAAAEAAAAAEAEAEEMAAAAIEAAGDDWRTKFLEAWNQDDDDDAIERGSVVSSTTARRRAEKAEKAEGGQPEWDASTVTSEKRAAAPTAAMEAAKELMESNPGLAAKHSLKSLASAVSTAVAKPPPEVVLPPLKLVTIHENPRVTEGHVDPSNLPYLHRNPAV